MLSVNVCRYTLLLLVFLCGRFPWVSFSWTSLQMGKAALELFSVQPFSCSSAIRLWVSKEKGHSPVIFKSFSFVQNMLYCLLRIRVLGLVFNSTPLFTNKRRRCQNIWWSNHRGRLLVAINHLRNKCVPLEKKKGKKKKPKNTQMYYFIFSFKNEVAVYAMHALK